MFKLVQKMLSKLRMAQQTLALTSKEMPSMNNTSTP
jgi:hypothetical protein